MSICDDLRAQRSAIAADIDTTKIDLQGAIADLKQDPHNKFLPRRSPSSRGNSGACGRS